MPSARLPPAIGASPRSLAGYGFAMDSVASARASSAARAQAELAVDDAEVAFDGLVAQEKRGGGLAIGGAAGDGECDLELLRCELLGGARVAAANSLTGRAQFALGPLGPGGGAEPVEDLERGVQLRTRLAAATACGGGAHRS